MPDQVTLITGAAGFIGSHLTDRLLSQGRRVVGFDNFCDFYDPAQKRRNIAPAASNNRFELIEADIRDRDAVFEAFAKHQPATVVHIAAMAGVRPSIENPLYYTQVNVDGTVNLLDAAVAHGCQRFVFASSSSVYGNNPKAPFSEDDPVDHPISPYAATKKACELICHTYNHLHKLPIICLRFFTVYGPRQRPDLAIGKFLRLVADGQPIPMFGDGSTSRDYTYINDLVDGITAAISRCNASPGYRLYNLGSNQPVSLKGLIATIEQVTAKQASVRQLPLQPGDVSRTWADLTRSQSELGYNPATPLADGIAKQWQWLTSQPRV